MGIYNNARSKQQSSSSNNRGRDEPRAFRQFVSPPRGQQQQRPYATSPSPQARPFVPQDRQSFRPIVQQGGGGGMRSPVQQHSPTQSNKSSSRRSSASPAGNAKYKMELCNNYMKWKTCPFGDNCHFAHGAAELNGCDACEIWVVTGAWWV